MSDCGKFRSGLISCFLISNLVTLRSCKILFLILNLVIFRFGLIFCVFDFD